MFLSIDVDELTVSNAQVNNQITAKVVLHGERGI